MKVSVQEYIGHRRSGTVDLLEKKAAEKNVGLFNPQRRFMKIKGITGKGKKKFRRVLRERAKARANVALEKTNNPLEGLIHEDPSTGLRHR